MGQTEGEGRRMGRGNGEVYVDVDGNGDRNVDWGVGDGSSGWGGSFREDVG